MPTPTPNPATANTAEPAARACVLLGCGDPVAWTVSDPHGGELPCCEADVTEVINSALARVPRHSSFRLEVWRA